jgi:hypothetical protein
MQKRIKVLQLGENVVINFVLIAEGMSLTVIIGQHFSGGKEQYSGLHLNPTHPHMNLGRDITFQATINVASRKVVLSL